jgi:16S rRNA (adenine1518-N6/adenine1519-N6)-dimethyltransferase
LIDFLHENFKTQVESGQLTIKEADILEFDENTGISDVFGAESSENQGKYKLIANIPYYITGAIIRKFLSSENQPELAVLLVQKEVAERIISKPEKNGTDKHPKNKGSLLSMSVKAYSEPKYVKTVLAGSFAPAPSVDSAIILLENINKDKFMTGNTSTPCSENPEQKISEEKFFDILHAGFAHKRKVLRKNLESFTKQNNIDKSKISEALKSVGKSETSRAEELEIDDWVCLLKKLSS